MLIDWALYGAIVYTAAWLINATFFKESPASSLISWALTIAVFSVSLVALSLLKALRSQLISDSAGYSIAFSNPIDLTGAFAFAWLFWAFLKRESKSVDQLGDATREELQGDSVLQKARNSIRPQEVTVAPSTEKPIRTSLRGWVRIGIVLSVAWVIMVTGRMWYELRSNSYDDSHYVTLWERPAWAEAPIVKGPEKPRPFDIQAARRDGIADAEIADELAPKLGFDLARARADGIPDREIADDLVARFNGVAPSRSKETGFSILERVDFSDLAERQRQGQTAFDIGLFLLAAFVPVLLAWSLVAIFIVTIRWVANGFKEP